MSQKVKNIGNKPYISGNKDVSFIITNIITMFFRTKLNPGFIHLQD
ncbi:hypothetical protein Mucpa_4650 [Mucilaginibacter paludis DSM 18603]|uniref:Uncharacterized protein n=1 Tax=Mucilaginibacter paludis DSM 18603 TaxID=714943 RepID=H1Y8X1_9SPHI|nr:hypothetical protein Mucpa_4650 [Mucilaginibacter paludis DSM 18603]